MLCCSHELASITVEDIQNDSEQLLHFHTCVWQARVALELLSKKKHYIAMAVTRSGKTFVFWLPKLYTVKSKCVNIPLCGGFWP